MKRFIILGLMLAVLTLAACSTQQPSTLPPTDGAAGTVPAGSLASQCETFGGTYLEEYQECEGIDAQSCQELGGTFNECASACRHEPEGRICTLQCVAVCQLG